MTSLMILINQELFKYQIKTWTTHGMVQKLETDSCIGVNGNNVTNCNGGIRPALWLKL